MSSAEEIDFGDIRDLDVREAVAGGIDKVYPKSLDDTDESIAERKQKEDQYTQEALELIHATEHEAKMAAALACIAPRQVLEHYGGREKAPDIIGKKATEILDRLSSKD